MTLAIALLDAGNEAHTRVETAVAQDSDTGFTIVVKTWEDSKVASVAVTWLAVGE